MGSDMTAFVMVTALLLGLAFGSFANVVIWRVPRGESITSPGSHCPRCHIPVRRYDNIPVVSWLMLRGRCRSCNQSISARYPLVETASGALWVLAALAFGPEARWVFAALFFWLLLVLTVIDLDTMRLPNPIVAALAVIGLSGAISGQFTGHSLTPLVADTGAPLLTAAFGAVLGAGLSGGVAGVYALVRGRSGFGMGDVKLLGAMGLFLGPYVLLALLIGSLTGAVVGIAAAARSGVGLQAKMPFGPFLALGGVFTALVGPETIRAYLSLVLT